MSRAPRNALTIGTAALLALGAACHKGSVTVLLQTGTNTNPMVDTLVAVDDAHGERVEIWTDRDGVARFPADWTGDGPFDVTVDGEDLGLLTVLGLDEQDDGRQLVFEKWSRRWPRWTTISGRASPRTPDTTLAVMPQRHIGDWYTTDGDRYRFDVPTDEPNTLIVAQYDDRSAWPGVTRDVASWHRFHLEPTLAHAITVDLDLSAPVAPVTDTGHIDIQDGPLRHVETRASVVVFSEMSDHVSRCGFATEVTPGPGGEGFAYELEYLPPTHDDAVSTSLMLRRDKYANVAWAETRVIWSRADRSGTPRDWAAMPELLPIPVFDLSGPYPSVYGNVDLEVVPADACARIVIRNGDEPFWILTGPPGETELAVPEPPSTFDTDKLDGDVNGMPNLIRTLDNGTDQAEGEIVRWL